MLILLWLTTRQILDSHLTDKICRFINTISPPLRDLVGTQFPALFTMKFHVFIDHMAPSISYHGSPLLSSAAPFERLNQTMGRSSNAYTTRTLLNISNRFLAMRRAGQHCIDVSDLKNLHPPATMSALCIESSLNHVGGKEEKVPLSEKEKLFLIQFPPDELVFSIDIEPTTSEKNQKQLGNNKKQFIYNNPEAVQQKYPYMKPYPKTEFHESEDDEESSGDENELMQSGADTRKRYDQERFHERESMDMDDYSDSDPTPSIYRQKTKQRIETNESFSLRKHLNDSERRTSSIDILKEAIDSGSVLEIGTTIREGFRNNTLSEIQIEEVCKSTRKPNISLLQFHRELETCDVDHHNSISMGQMFLTKWAMTESHDINKLKASVSSLASSFSEQTKLGTLSKRTLETEHVIPSSGKFPRMDLVSVYNKSSLVGDTAFSQMTFFLTRVFKSILNPSYEIWFYTYRPKCVRPADKHFSMFPECIADSLIDFAYDAIGVHLPNHLLHGEVDAEGEFVKKMKLTDKLSEIQRRRKDREMISDTMKSAIGQMLNYLRDYHFNIETGDLDNCRLRSMCRTHLTWKDLKAFRDQARENSNDPESFNVEDVVGFASKNNKASKNTSNGHDQG